MSDVMPYESTIYGEMTPEMIENWKKAFEPAVHQAVADFKAGYYYFSSSLVFNQLHSQVVPRDKSCSCQPWNGFAPGTKTPSFSRAVYETH